MTVHAGTEEAPNVGRLLLRLAAGGFLIPHAAGKLWGAWGGPGISGFQQELAQFGLPDDLWIAWCLALLQLWLGFTVAVGIATRVHALAAFAFLGATVALNAANGWFWMAGGVEYPLLWACALLAIALLGPGRWSVDATRAPNRMN